jgi:fructokinase
LSIRNDQISELQSNLIKLNDEEWKSSPWALSGDLLEKAARNAAQAGCQRLCITAGARGAGLLDGDKWYWVDGRSVVVKDTVGAEIPSWPR